MKKVYRFKKDLVSCLNSETHMLFSKMWSFLLMRTEVMKIFTNNQSYCKLQVYFMSTKTKFNVIYCNHMFQPLSILKSTFPTPSTLPS